MTQQQPYDVLRSLSHFEVRLYPTHLVAEVEVDASFTRAGNDAFGVLVAYISGRNSTRGKVAMTAPVLQERASATIEMTSAVVQQASGESGRHVVAFVMPTEFTLDTLPTPADPRINVREVPAHVAAVRSFTGRWTEHIYERQLTELRSAVEQAGLEISGPPRFARFDPRGRRGSVVATRWRSPSGGTHPPPGPARHIVSRTDHRRLRGTTRRMRTDLAAPIGSV